MPKVVYRPAPIVAGQKMGDDGAELTALVSIMMGAIKELHHRIDALEGKFSQNMDDIVGIRQEHDE